MAQHVVLYAVEAYAVVNTVKKKLCTIDGHPVNAADEHVHLILRGNCPALKVYCLLTRIPAYPFTGLSV